MTDRLSSLRSIMKQQSIDAYILPLGDPHQSEYPASYWKGLQWISGFTGSAGTVVISQDHAGLWTDSRYFIQAEQELAHNPFVLHKMDGQRSPSFVDWCAEALGESAVVAVDGPMISLAQKSRYSSQLSRKGLTLKLTEDLIGAIWADRPPIPVDEVFVHAEKYHGEPTSSKLARIREEMQQQGATAHLITTLDDIAWLTNLRGRDVKCNPVFVAHCIVQTDKVLLFIQPGKVSTPIKEALLQDGIHILPYDSLVEHLGALTTADKLLIHEGTLNVQLKEAISSQATTLSGSLIPRHLKAIKNSTEIGHLESVHVKDAIALTHAFMWLEHTLTERTVTEYEYAAKIAECRGEREGYFGESFSAIVGYRGNGAIVHYRPELDSSAEISREGILLVDSGGQYQDGTTDITRTIALSAPSDAEKRAYTRVLQGHISLATAVFPEGTTGGQLDALARQHLWRDGLNYGHGTGHGVGFFLNVHEPPQGFAPGLAGRAASVIKEGMFTSNEPGHYVADAYGIRIENLILCEKAQQDGFLRFRTITYFPIDTTLVDFSLMTKADVAWLNEYHDMVKEKLTPHLNDNQKRWMEDKCKRV